MRILVIGSGGREHALAWRLGRGQEAAEGRKIICAPGNAGIARHAECVDVGTGDLDGLVRLAVERSVDLVVIGPEAPLVAGLADRLRGEGVAVLGPGSRAAALEGSKAYAKDLMMRAGIPTARYGVFEDSVAARFFARELGGRVAVKADGLAAGKGVILCRTVEESESAISSLMEQRSLGTAGEKVVIEELLEGDEASFLALCDGVRALPLASSRDHKAAFDGDQGPNTGGMGAFSPTRLVDTAMEQRIVREVMQPALRALSEDGAPFIGLLYAGLMFTGEGPKVLEFNVRFGDPETQPLMMRVRGDLAPVLLAAAEGDLSRASLDWDPRAAVCVVMASGGYPGSYETGLAIEGLASSEDEPGLQHDLMIFHAGTRRGADGRKDEPGLQREARGVRGGSGGIGGAEGGEAGRAPDGPPDLIVTCGGRVLGITALGETLEEARSRAYDATSRVRFEGAHFRTDIGLKESRSCTI